MADGSVRFVPIISEEAARDLLTGDYSDIDALELHKEAYRVSSDNVVRLTIFVALSLFPFYGVVLRIRSERVGKRS